MARNPTEQEEFWKGEFGASYIDRNQGDGWIAANTAFFAPILQRTGPLDGVLEIGANIGLNLKALAHLQPGIALSGLEINQQAARELEAWGGCEVLTMAAQDFSAEASFDLVFTKGVMIHLDPASLAEIYQSMVDASRRFILVAEYYNPAPVTITYRGHDNRLFKRDFAGEMLDTFPELQLVDYGFSYHRDPVFPQDDITWFLLEKTTGR